MNILSLFDGCSCGQLALNSLGIHYDNYFSSEIDKWAIAVAQYNYPKTIRLGNIQKLNVNIRQQKKKSWYDLTIEWAGNNGGVQNIVLNISKIDLLIAGSPCQSFSKSGKQLNFKDPRGELFFEFVRILKECQPTYFLLENVQMKKEWADIITDCVEVEPILIDSAKLTAQSRKRLYWTNIPNIVQPEDKGVLLCDIIENGKVDRDKSYCIDANYYKGGNLTQYYDKCRRQLVFKKKYQSSRRLQVKDKVKGWRMLTPTECEALQGIPYNYTKLGKFGYGLNTQTKEISKTQRYKLMGNSFTCDVISYILNFAKDLK